MMEGLKMFTIEVKPVLNDTKFNNSCYLINPDFVNIVIEDIYEDCKLKKNISKI